VRHLVTGGAGFIGSHLVTRLLADGHEVVVLDNYSTGRQQNLAHVDSHPALTLVQTDIAADDVSGYFDGVHSVFHIAALGDIVPSIEQPIGYYRSNVGGTIAVLEAARAAGTQRFLYAASSSCYGIPDHYPTPETAEIRPQYPYALTKWLAEQSVLHWGQVYGLPVISLRLFNVFGPRSRTSGTYGAVFGVFLAQKLAGEPFTVVGNGTQTRDFTFVSDVAEAFLAAETSDVAGEVFNVGTGNPQSVRRLVELLGGGGTVTLPVRPAEPDTTHADISKIRRMIGWEPRVSFEDGVAQVVENIDYWREAVVWTPAAIEDATRTWFQYLGGDRSPPAG
jgi:UDP-glucose 4-epimerase